MIRSYFCIACYHIAWAWVVARAFPRCILKISWWVLVSVSNRHASMLRIADVMTADPITVRKETRLEAAARILLDKRIRRLPVVDAEGKLVGMFSRGDVIKAAVRTRDLIRSVSGSQEDLWCILEYSLAVSMVCHIACSCCIVLWVQVWKRPSGLYALYKCHCQNWEGILSRLFLSIE